MAEGREGGIQGTVTAGVRKGGSIAKTNTNPHHYI